LTISHPTALEIALADANVFYSHHQRNVFVTLAYERLFALRWTGKIEREWHEALIRNRPDLDAERLRQTIEKMNRALPGSHIEDYAQFENLLSKTDPKDRHVAAAAIKCAPATLVTWNVRHFNAQELSVHKVCVKDPDAFLCLVFDRDPIDTLEAVARAYGFLKRPAGRPTWAEYLDALERERLAGFVERLRLREPEEGAEEILDIANVPTGDGSKPPDI
jgi:hypothetical protein